MDTPFESGRLAAMAPVNPAGAGTRQAPQTGQPRRSRGSSHYLARLLWLFGPTPDCSAQQQAFVALRKAFRAHGGLVRGDRVEQRLDRLQGPGVRLLAQRVAAGELIGFEFEGALWLPLMQFDPADMSPEPALARVAIELAGVFDGWDLCCWLAAPSPSLRDCAPMDVLESDPLAVLQAAREARFIAGG
jgi:hypothetical protein